MQCAKPVWSCIFIKHHMHLHLNSCFTKCAHKDFIPHSSHIYTETSSHSACNLLYSLHSSKNTLRAYWIIFTPTECRRDFKTHWRQTSSSTNSLSISIHMCASKFARRWTKSTIEYIKLYILRTECVWWMPTLILAIHRLSSKELSDSIHSLIHKLCLADNCA